MRKGQKMTEEQRKKHSDSLKGRKLTFKSEETRLKMLSNLKKTPWNVGLGKKFTIVCKTCSKEFITSKSTRKFCSIKCSSKMTSGNNHWKWVDDRSKIKLDKERGGPLHKKWSKDIKNRDNWKCKINNHDCVSGLVAHHILSWSKNPEYRYDINNGITLCHFHHPRKRKDEIELEDYFKSLIS